MKIKNIVLAVICCLFFYSCEKEKEDKIIEIKPNTYRIQILDHIVKDKYGKLTFKTKPKYIEIYTKGTDDIKDDKIFVFDSNDNLLFEHKYIINYLAQMTPAYIYLNEPYISNNNILSKTNDKYNIVDEITVANIVTIFIKIKDKGIWYNIDIAYILDV